MKQLALFLLVQVFGFLVCLTPCAQARVDGYEDLAAWANRDVEDFVQFKTDLKHAGSAPKLASTFQAAATRQRKTTDDLIALVRIHPELRDLPTLGLDAQGQREWRQSHPDGRARIKRAPAAARAINQRMANAIARTPKIAPAAGSSLGRYMHDPQVTTALRRLEDTLQDNRRRLLKTFS